MPQREKSQLGGGKIESAIKAGENVHQQSVGCRENYESQVQSLLLLLWESKWVSWPKKMSPLAFTKV